MTERKVDPVRKEIKKTLSSMVALLALLLIVLSSTVVKADGEAFDLDRKGSITVILYDNTEEHAALPGEFRLFFVARAVVSNYNLDYVLTDEFADSGVSLSDINADGLAKTLSEYAAEKQVEAILGTPVESGGELFSDLTLGIYLVEEIGSVEGYEPISPFLVWVPMADVSGEGWIYDIEASPKAEPSEPPAYVVRTVRKVWQDEESETRPTSITVKLLMDGEVYDTVVLNAENEWKYTWTELPDGHSYTVEENVPFEYVASYSYGQDEIVITNTARLPRTGQLKWPIPVLAVAGSVLLVLGIVFATAEKKRKENNQ